MVRRAITRRGRPAIGVAALIKKGHHLFSLGGDRPISKLEAYRYVEPIVTASCALLEKANRYPSSFLKVGNQAERRGLLSLRILKMGPLPPKTTLLCEAADTLFLHGSF